VKKILRKLPCGGMAGAEGTFSIPPWTAYSINGKAAVG
jgi:hypothetical protein